MYLKKGIFLLNSKSMKLKDRSRDDEYVIDISCDDEYVIKISRDD
jgi:hypothetical protein